MSLCKTFICKLHWSGAIHYYFGNFFLRNNLPYEQNVKVCKTWDTDQLILEMRDYCALIKVASSPKWNPAAPGTHRALVCSWDALCSLYFVHLRLHRLAVGLTPHCCFEKHALHSWRTIKKSVFSYRAQDSAVPLSPSAPFYTQELRRVALLPTSLELGLQPPLWTLVSQKTLHPTQTQTSCA